MGQWNVDTNGYYSDINAKYVTYHDKSGGHFFEDGKRALSNGLAIAQILNRILILPKFQLSKDQNCPLNCFARITNFDEHFNYRESEFLNHPLVPTGIREAKSVFNASANITAKWQHVDDLQVLNALGKIASPVIDMGEALANITITFRNIDEQHDFIKRVTNGFVRATYRQVWYISRTWWRHQMETFSTLMTLCEGNPPVTGRFPSQGPVTRSFEVFFICAW